MYDDGPLSSLRIFFLRASASFLLASATMPLMPFAWVVSVDGTDMIHYSFTLIDNAPLLLFRSFAGVFISALIADGRAAWPTFSP